MSETWMYIWKVEICFQVLYILNNPNCDKFIVYSSLHCIYNIMNFYIFGYVTIWL